MHILITAWLCSEFMRYAGEWLSGKSGNAHEELFVAMKFKRRNS